MTIDGSDSRTDRVAEIFHRALDLPAGERERFLDGACAGDEGLREEVDAILRSDGDAPDGFLPGGRRRSPSGTRIGSYEILECLGEGGMGTVYAARQDFPRREVALKLIRSGRLSADAAQRFEKEVHALGSLQHPGIAQIFDAGTARVRGPGRREREEPFLAMELVRGKPLLEYATAKELDVRERLELVARIADAVHHAHQRGIIHRDLKPENVLVTEDETRTDEAPATWSAVGQPKVLDFGIARITGDAGSSVTRAGELLGTLSYMSPEQIEGDSGRVDERSDVYALGVLCYQLLAGTLPHDLAGLSVPEAVRAMRTQRPVPLGERDPRLRGDVSTIAARALDEDRERRYPSAAALADDLRRHLRGAPIRARSDSTLYVLRRGLRRHRMALAVAVLFLVGGAAIAYMWRDKQTLARQADDQFAKALQAIELFEQFGAEHFDQSPRQRQILETALAQQEELLRGREDDPRARLAHALTQARVVLLRSVLGEEEGTGQLQAAVDDLEELRGTTDGVDEELSRILCETARYHRNAGELGLAEERLLRALELEGSSVFEKARATARLGDLHGDRGRPDTAIEHWSAALALLDAPELAESLLAQRARWECFSSIGTVHAEAGRLDEAALAFGTLEEIASRLETSGDALDKAFVVNVRNNLATLAFRRGETDGVTSLMEPTARLAQELYEEFPENAHFREVLAGTLFNLGAHQANEGRFDEARSSMLRADELFAEILRSTPDDVGARGMHGQLLVNLGKLGTDTDGFAEALPRLEEGARLLEGATAVYPGKRSWQAQLQEARLYRAYCLVQTGRHAEGVQAVTGTPLEWADPSGLETLEIFCVALQAVRQDERLSDADRASAHDTYLELALQHVARMSDGGFTDLAQLRSDPRYAALQAEPAFQSLLELLES